MKDNTLEKYNQDLNKNIHIRDLYSLKDRVAIVTGGAGLYGSVISTALAEAGATVVIASRNVKKCKAKADELRAQGLDAVGMQLDLSVDESIVALKDAVGNRFGKIDILFNNAAGRAAGTAEAIIKAAYKQTKTSMAEMTREMWDRSMAVNSSGFFMCCQTFAKDMRAKRVKGAIVNISSIYGNVGPDFSIYGDTGMTSPPDYSYSKAGIINFTRYMATFYGRFGIRVNCISPGGYYTKSLPQEFVERYESHTPLGRMAGWNDLKGAAVFLASDASRYITGHNLMVDGGWTTW